MRRIGLGLLLWTILFPAFLTAQTPDAKRIIGTIAPSTDGLEFETLDGVTRIGNGEVSVLWNAEKRTVGVCRAEGEFATLALPDGAASIVARHPVRGREGSIVHGISLVVQREDSGVDVIFTLSERSPFVLISKLFSREMFQDGPLTTLNFPAIELVLPESTEKSRVFGSDRPETAGEDRSSLLYLAVVDPATRGGVVSGFVTGRQGVGVVSATRNAEGRWAVSPVVHYEKLEAPADPDDPMQNLSEVFVLGRFDDCRIGLERYAWQIARANPDRVRRERQPSSVVSGSPASASPGDRKVRSTQDLLQYVAVAGSKLAPYGLGKPRFDDLPRFGDPSVTEPGDSRLYFLYGRVWRGEAPVPFRVADGSPEQAARTASWFALTGRPFAVADWLPGLDDRRIDILRRTMRPHDLRSVRPVDYFDASPKAAVWHLTTPSSNRPEITRRDVVGLFNWNESEPTQIELETARIGLPEAKEYVAFDYWGNALIGPFGDRLSVELKPAGCVVLAVRPVGDRPMLLSTSQHVTQGVVDVVEENWDPATKTLFGTSRVIAGDDYELRIYDPAKKELRRETLKPTETSDAFPWSVAF